MRLQSRGCPRITRARAQENSTRAGSHARITGSTAKTLAHRYVGGNDVTVN